MILSYHPCVVADENRICAGRMPDTEDLSRIRAADAVVLPQGCGRALYEMARQNSAHFFPNYDARFAYPDKISQIRLFKKTGARFPETQTFPRLDAFTGRYPDQSAGLPFDYPLVFKFNWGGEGETVSLILSETQLADALETARTYERTGQSGFMLQRYIPSDRSLRVAVIGRKFYSYWRIPPDDNGFLSTVAKGATIDSAGEQVLQNRGVEAVKAICRKTGINLAGFDLVFSDEGEAKTGEPYFLEINYFFGRKGLGGSKAYYRLLNDAVREWLEGLNPPVLFSGCEPRKGLSNRET